jgi:hypothetical protein
MLLKPLPKERIDSQDFVIGGVTYEIMPRKSQGRYVAPWLCLKCSARGVSSASAATHDEAISRAHRNLLNHHNAIHSDKR